MKITWKAQPRQARFLKEVLDPNGADEILFGGAAGAGKTDVLLIAAIIYAQKGGRVIFLRRTFRQLEGKPIPRSKELIPRSVAKYLESKYRWEFVSGGVIQFGYLEKRGDEENYQGHEYELVCWDELTHFDHFQYTYLLSRNRTTKAGLKPKSIAASNPGSRGHSWVKARWIDGHEPEEVWEASEVTTIMNGEKVEARKRVFIPGKLTDNQILMKSDPGYLARLLELPEAQQRMLLHGDWEYFEGMAFPEFRPDVHVIKPFTIPETWRRFRAVDYGRTNPFCCLWFAIDHDGDLFVYRELYEAGLNASDQARKIVERSTMMDENGHRVPEKIDYTILDTACWIKNQYGESIAETYANNGVYVYQADKDRINGKNLVHEWLKIEERDDGEKVSRIHFFDTCKHMIEALRSLPTDPDNPEDVDTDSGLDHSYDALRYGVQSRPRPRKEKVNENKSRIQKHKDRIKKKTIDHNRRFA